MSTQPSGTIQPVPSSGLIKSTRELAAGLFLLALAGAAYVGTYDLNFGHLTGIGPGMLPKAMAVSIGAFGLYLVANGLFFDGPKLDSFSVRGIIFVIGSVALFAATIRTMGLIVAGPLTVIVAALADRETRLVEILLFSVMITAVCIGMFKFVLGLPIPVLPVDQNW